MNVVGVSKNLIGQFTEARIPALVARDLARLQPTYMESEVSYRDIDTCTL